MPAISKSTRKHKPRFTPPPSSTTLKLTRRHGSQPLGLRCQFEGRDVVVGTVKKGSVAAVAGLVEGDVILAIDGIGIPPVKDGRLPDDFSIRALLQGSQLKLSTMVTVLDPDGQQDHGDAPIPERRGSPDNFLNHPAVGQLRSPEPPDPEDAARAEAALLKIQEQERFKAEEEAAEVARIQQAEAEAAKAAEALRAAEAVAEEARRKKEALDAAVAELARVNEQQTKAETAAAKEEEEAPAAREQKKAERSTAADTAEMELLTAECVAAGKKPPTEMPAPVPFLPPLVQFCFDMQREDIDKNYATVSDGGAAAAAEMIYPGMAAACGPPAAETAKGPLHQELQGKVEQIKVLAMEARLGVGTKPGDAATPKLAAAARSARGMRDLGAKLDQLERDAEKCHEQARRQQIKADAELAVAIAKGDLEDSALERLRLAAERATAEKEAAERAFEGAQKAAEEVKMYLEGTHEGLELMMDPKWDKTYGPGGTNDWDGPACDGEDRGDEPYYCPKGWKRFAIRVPDSRWDFAGTTVAYHGTQSTNTISMLKNGFRGTTGMFLDGGSTAGYFTPSIVYASHVRYAKTWKRGRGTDGMWVQMVFQCRVKAKALTKRKPETLGARGTVDPNFKDNSDLTWLLPATVPEFVRVTGAGEAGCNGVYLPKDVPGCDADRVRSYVQQGGSLVLLRSEGARWMIADMGPEQDLGLDAGAFVVYTAENAGERPPADGWVVEKGAAPAPRLSRMNWRHGFVDPSNVVIYGIMVRETKEHPMDRPEMSAYAR